MIWKWPRVEIAKASTPRKMLRRRCLSAPPLCISDVGTSFDIVGKDELVLSPKDMFNFHPLKTLMNTPSCKVTVLQDGLVLKLRPILVDAELIARNMILAAAVIKVPKVYRYGYSGNCSFILMEYIHAADLQALMSIFGIAALHKVEKEIRTIIRKLAMIGISHNDLYPRNVLVGLDWKVAAVVDWDESGPLIGSKEYARRVCWDHDIHDWDYIFLGNSIDSFDHLDLRPSPSLYNIPPLIRYPPGRTIGPLVDAITTAAALNERAEVKGLHLRNGTDKRRKFKEEGQSTRSGGRGFKVAKVVGGPT